MSGHLQKHAQDTSFLTFLLYWLFPEYDAANIARRPCDSSHVTAHYKSSFHYYYYY